MFRSTETANMWRSIDCSNTLSLDIRLGSQTSNQPFVSSFATSERIEGTVVVVSENHLPFDNMHICFVGEQSTNIPSDTPNMAHHEFLRLKHSAREIEAALPNSKVFKKGIRHEIPFSFVVPDYLTPSACHHADPWVKAAHLHMPPSCGDQSIAGFGGKLRDDSAPETCKVIYSIDVKLERPNSISGVQETIMQRRLKIRIKPAIGDVPLPLPESSDESSLTQERFIHDGARLSATLEQPSCFYLPLRDPIRLISKAVRLLLVYSGSSTPPQIKSLRAQIIATTIYTTTPDASLSYPPPKRRDFFKRPINFRDVEVSLSIPAIPRLSWSQEETGKFTSTLLVPVTLPKDVSFIPTFHSCLMSRVYTLALQISVKGITEPWKLKASMLIAAERDPDALPSYNASLGVLDTDDA
ncbi:uncharacterized protein BDV14DRAFT_77505 [Aspergillus stella-maris]|uniref:uncharacterized protein n=1 Tax=Aspergillus stella-maris TaxID=1810926 RepID=UPI003CCCA9CC